MRLFLVLLEIAGRIVQALVLTAVLLALTSCGWPFTCAPASTLIATCGRVHPIGLNPRPSAYVPPPPRGAPK